MRCAARAGDGSRWRGGLGARKRRWVRRFQRYLLNPPVKAVVWLGLAPGYVLLETTGARTGKRRRNVVGMNVTGTTGWVVSEQGRYAGYVNNLRAHPQVRVRRHSRWHDARASVDTEDDVDARLASFGRVQATTVRRFGTDLTTVRVDFGPG